MTPWLLVSGDFAQSGGMDTANHALASYLARRPGTELHLVAHHISPELASRPSVHVHSVRRPFGSHTLGEPSLRKTAAGRARSVGEACGHVVANGGNLDAGDVTWVHYVHAAHLPAAAGLLNRAMTAVRHRRYLRAERRALTRARLVICNSSRTVEDVVDLGVERARTRRVYYGIDPLRFSPSEDRSAARAALGYHDDRPVVLFVGALGDRRKGFDTLFDAWRRVCGRSDWDGSLMVAGTGAELAAWKARAASCGEVAARTRFLGYRHDVPALMAAADLLVHPARYEAYGLAVHEALCCGVPAIVPALSGVAERYTHELRPLLLHDIESAEELAARLRAWREARPAFRAHAQSVGEVLRARTWDDMAHEIVAHVEC